jgi:hypothetical protein
VKFGYSLHEPFALTEVMLTHIAGKIRKVMIDLPDGIVVASNSTSSYHYVSLVGIILL